MQPNHVVDVLFQLMADMMKGEARNGASLRPPSLRDACYACVLAMRNPGAECDPEMIEAFVNGLEWGALSAIRDAWEKRNA